MIKNVTKLPRLYVTDALQGGRLLSLASQPMHYFKTVLRRQPGDFFRVFNGRDGEWLAQINELSKRNGSALVTERIRKQPQSKPAVHLLLSPVKKHRLDMIIEKSVELGVTDFQPILMQRTDVRKINTRRIEIQIIEATEQCERLTIPTLHTLQPMESIIAKWDKSIPLYACLERSDSKILSAYDVKGDAAFLIGPVGGFSDDECSWLNTQNHVQATSLGETVLRCETAALACLSYHMLTNS